MEYKSAELLALLEGILYGLRPVTDVYNVKLDDNTLLADKLQEIITSLNGKVKTVNGTAPDSEENDEKQMNNYVKLFLLLIALAVMMTVKVQGTF